MRRRQRDPHTATSSLGRKHTRNTLRIYFLSSNIKEAHEHNNHNISQELACSWNSVLLVDFARLNEVCLTYAYNAATVGESRRISKGRRIERNCMRDLPIEFWAPD